MAAVAVRDPQGGLQSTDAIVTEWKRRLEQAREARRPYEPVMLSNLAFAGGQHWLAWDRTVNQMRHLSELDGRYASRNLYTADRITEYVRAQLGELSVGDDRLDLQAVQAGETPGEVAKELNAAVEYAWLHEWNAQKALRRVRGYALTISTAAIRCRFDPSKGPVAGHLPLNGDGQPAIGPDDQAALQAHGTLADGSLPTFQPVNEGRTVWEPLTSFHLFVPPGIPHEDDFPWEAVGRPVPLDQVQDEFGEAAKGLVEDGDIASAAGIATGQRVAVGSNQARLRGHVWLYTCYDRPCKRYPNGRVVVLASNSYRLLQVRDQLDYKRPNGDWHTGIVYFHWQRLSDRFWSRAFVENMKDGQRTINEIKTTQLEILWRGLPKVFTKEGDLIHNPRGLPLEVIELKADAAQPAFFAGVGPGQWMDAMLAACDNDLSHASTLSPLRLGENPQGVDTYSQLQLLNQNEAYKRSDIIVDHLQQIATLEELGVYDIRQYWPEQKKILVAGEDGSIQAATFSKSTIPVFFQAKVADGVALDRSEAAELAKVDAIWRSAAEAGTVAHDPQAWTDWYARSLDAGQSLPLPDVQQDSQAAVAHYENTLMLNGETPTPADHDVMPTHIPIHREALDGARAAGDTATADRIQRHIDWSIQVATVARKQWRVADPSDTADTASELALDEDQALRENQMMIAGQPLNPEEYQKALASLQQGINPETGQPVPLSPVTGQPTVDLRLILLRASLKPTLIENLTMHMDRHGTVVKSEEFQHFPPDVRERFLIHFDLTRELYLSLPLLPDKMTPPKVSLSLKGDVGPSSVAKIAHRGGVPELDPNEIATELPLETNVEVRDMLKDAPLEHGDPMVDPDTTAADDTQQPQQ